MHILQFDSGAHICAFLLDVYLGVEILDHRSHAYPTVVGTAREISKVDIPAMYRFFNCSTLSHCDKGNLN